MTDDSHNTLKLSERFSDLFGVDVNELDSSSGLVSKTIYLEESRKLNLNKLLHLAPYSEVLLLLGGLGVGKTTLLNAFVARSATTWRTICITATALMTPLDFLRAVAQSFELEVDDATSEDDLLWQLERFVQALGRSGRRAIVVIDDAHMLTDDVLRQVETFLSAGAAEQALSLLLCMRQEYESKLSQFALLHEKLAYTLNLQPLNKKELQGYLRLKLANSGVNMEQVFTPDVVNELLRSSGGLPESINELAQEILANQAPRRKVPDVVKRPISQYVAVAIAVLLVAVALYFQDSINRLFEDQPALPELSNEAVPQLEIAESTPSIVEQAPTLVLGDDKLIPEEVVLPPEIVEQVAEPIAPTTDELQMKVAPEPAIAEERVQPAQPVVEKKLAPVAEIAEVVEEEVTEEETAAPAPAAGVEDVATPEADPELVWIRAQPKTNYTMQLMALVDHDKVQRFVAKHGIESESATYIKSRKGKALMVLLYGSYTSRKDALEASKQVPKNWYVGQPWVRSFASVTPELAPQ